MDNKIIDMNEWVRWVLEQHPSQNQITTIKKYWKCHKLGDYEKVFKDKIEHVHSYWWDGKDYSNEWVDHKYGWELDRLFDIQKFVPDCPQLSKVDIGYFAIQDTLNSEKWAPYLQVITEYEKHEVKRCKNPDKINRQNEPHTFRIVKLDLGEFQIYARQARALYNEDRHIHVINSNTKNLDDELKNGYKVYWDEEQVMFITVPKIKINKSLLKGSVSLQKEKRLYIFNDNNTYGVHTNRYRLPELYYPTNMKEFIAYCHDKDLFDFASSSISLWSKTDKDADWSEEKAKYWGESWYTQERCVTYTPWPMRNIKSEIELDSYIQERKELKAIELSEHLSKHVVALYDKDILFPVIKTITQETCNEFIEEYNNRKLFEIIK